MSSPAQHIEPVDVLPIAARQGDPNLDALVMSEGESARSALPCLEPAVFGWSVFVPVGVNIDESLVSDLNVSAYLDFSIPNMLERYPVLLAMYAIDTRGVTRFYPNIDLASILPPDFDATQRPYFSISSPLFNPKRMPRWTIPYVDATGAGLVVTVAAPVYDNDEFVGVIAADMQLSEITQQISKIEVGETGYAFMIDDAGRVLSMPPQGYEMFGIRPEDQPKLFTYFEQLGAKHDHSMKGSGIGLALTLATLGVVATDAERARLIIPAPDPSGEDRFIFAHELIRQTVGEFARSRVAPLARRIDQEDWWPDELVPELAQQGLFGVVVPEALGGSGLDTVSWAIVMEEMAKVSGSVALSLAAHNSLGMGHILLHGSQDQKERFVPDLARGKKLAAWGLTEPGSGSDASEADDRIVMYAEPFFARNVNVPVNVAPACRTIVSPGWAASIAA